MKSHYSNEINGRFVAVLACGCLLATTTPAMAQTVEQPDLELEPVVLDDPAERSAVENGEIAATHETYVEEELAPIVLDARRLVEEAYYDDASADINAEIAAMPETYDETVQRLFIAYKEAVFDKMFEEADTLGKQIVELSIGVNGLDSRKTATALTNLALAQHGLEQYTAAILNYTAAIGIIERVEDRLNAALINPLRGLGAAQFASDRQDEAKKTFDRAIHISHVNDGPHNLEQIESLMSLTEILLAVDQTKAAVNIQKRIFYLQARNTEPDSLDFIPALQTRARWQRRMQFYEQERLTRRRIIRIIEAENGKRSLDLIEPLTKLAKSYLAMASIILPERLQPVISSGEPYLKRAVRIAERNPDSTFRILVDTKMELADYYILVEKSVRANRVYRDVWDLLSEDEANLGLRASMLESGLLLRKIYPPTMANGKDVTATDGELTEYRSGTVRFKYNVSTRGRATRVTLLDADPKGLDDLYKKISRELRYIVHRPRFVDGEPAESVDLIFSHQFFYQDADLEGADEGSDVVTEKAAAN